MIEPEIAFADLQDNMRLAEEMVKFLIAFILKQAPEEMEFFNSFVDQGLLARLKQVMDADFARITYTQAIEVLQETGEEFEYPVLWGADLQSEHERYLTEKILKKPVFVTDYPKDIKA
jgi:asparaginyl-tRNA synthetase